MSLLDKSEVKLKAKLLRSSWVVGTIPEVEVFPKEKRKFVPDTERVTEKELLVVTPVRKN